MKKFILLLSLFPLVSLADWTRISPRGFSLQPPPSIGSREYQRDFEILHEYQRTRSREDCALSLRQEHSTYQAMYASKDSPLSAREADQADHLVSEVMELATRISSYHKSIYLRPRPFNVDRTLEPCAVKPGGSRAYPSSHATAASAGACVLAEIFPYKRQELLAYGKKIGDLRFVVGVHHPSDVEAGQGLAQELCDRLLKDPEFRADLARVKH